MENPPKIQCPKCGSDQITANKKGFSGKKAVAGAVLTGGVGLLAGTIGSNKVVITCLSCGNTWRPGQKSGKSKFVPTAQSRKLNKILLLIILGIIILTIIVTHL